LIIIHTEEAREVKSTTTNSSRGEHGRMPVSLRFTPYITRDEGSNGPMVTITQDVVDDARVVQGVYETGNRLDKDRLWAAQPNESYDLELGQHAK
jgi:hypothetical protein